MIKNFLMTQIILRSIWILKYFQEGGPYLPKRDDDPVLCHFSNVDYVDTWKAMEAVAKKGLAKSIGVSNFSKRQVERILEMATIKPVNNQVRFSCAIYDYKVIDCLFLPTIKDLPD